MTSLLIEAESPSLVLSPFGPLSDGLIGHKAESLGHVPTRSESQRKERVEDPSPSPSSRPLLSYRSLVFSCEFLDTPPPPSSSSSSHVSSSCDAESREEERERPVRGAEGFSVLIRPLSGECTSVDVTEMLEEAGGVKALFLPVDKKSGTSHGFAVALFEDEQKARQVVENGHLHVCGQPVKASWAFVRRKEGGEIVED